MNFDGPDAAQLLHHFCDKLSIEGLCLGFSLKGEIQERCEALSDSYAQITLSLIQILFLKGVFVVIFR